MSGYHFFVKWCACFFCLTVNTYCCEYLDIVLTGSCHCSSVVLPWQQWQSFVYCVGRAFVCSSVSCWQGWYKTVAVLVYGQTSLTQHNHLWPCQSPGYFSPMNFTLLSCHPCFSPSPWHGCELISILFISGTASWPSEMLLSGPSFQPAKATASLLPGTASQLQHTSPVAIFLPSCPRHTLHTHWHLAGLIDLTHLPNRQTNRCAGRCH